MRLLKIICLLFPVMLGAQQHPVIFFNSSEAAELKKSLNSYPLLKKSFLNIRQDVDSWIGKDVDVPLPKDPAGGYTHDRHKANYTLLFHAGILYNLTGEKKYADFARTMFLKYAKLNPTLVKHPQATSSSPGRLFWQALNDANWLVYAGMAYDLIYNLLSASDRKLIEEGAFRPEVEFMTRDLKKWFDLIHNHGVWACAGVGIAGIATNNKEWIDMALYGTEKKGSSGFIAQMNGLFSPDGYYTEGPYYVRYAILPYYLFAQALHNARPELKIFEHRDRILQKALLSALQLTNLDGTFFPLNDALKEKDYTSNELVTAVSIAWNVYGKDNGLLFVADKQNRVLLNKGGASIAASLAGKKDLPAFFPYETVEYADGVDGTRGGVAVMRNGKGGSLTSLVYKYTSHGLSHGHFDKLSYNLFDQGHEILTDYGSVRFIGVEQKYGGRYLRENDHYAAQTIAHNTITMDETSHFQGHEETGEKHHAEKLFSSYRDPRVQVVAARDKNAYPGSELHRTVYLIELPGGKKLVADIFHVNTTGSHTYDLPFHYSGQLISTSFKFKTHTKNQVALGAKNGYQFLWNEAEARLKDTVAQLTFLNNRTYYTISALIQDSATVFHARTGANDPDFNLRHEPALIFRKYGGSQSFLNLVEIHGKFDPVIEFSTNAYSSVQGMKFTQVDQYSHAEIIFGGKKLTIVQSNADYNENTKHVLKGLSWTGPFAVFFNERKLEGK